MAKMRESFLDGHFALDFDWNLTSQSPANNTSTINWTLSLYIGSGAEIRYLMSSWQATINGTKYSDKNDYDFDSHYGEQSITLLSGTSTIAHNADGSGTLEVNFSWKPSVGAMTFKYNGEVIAQGSSNTTGVVDGTVGRIASTQTAALPKITWASTISNVTSNLTDESSPVITFSNPLGSSATLTAKMVWDDTGSVIATRSVSGSSTSCTFSLSSSEKSTLWTKLNTGATYTRVRFYITTSYSGKTYTSNEVSRQITYVNYTPTLSPTIYDTNSRTLALTGNRNILVKGMSDAYFSTGATARKGATIDNQYIKNGDQTISNKATGTITGVNSNTFYLSVTDNRGYTTQDAKVFSIDNGYFIDYIKLTCNITTDEMSPEGKLNVTVSGKYFKGSFGSKNNTLELEYGLRKEDGDINWTKLGIVTPTTDSNNNYEYKFTITGLDYLSVYNLTVNAIDELMPQASTATVIVAAKPVFDWSKTDFKFYVPVYFNNTDIPLENVADYVRLEGTSNGWYYREWYSGKVELWCSQNISYIACNTALGGWYRTAVQTAPEFPFTVNNPHVTANYESDGYGALVWATTKTTTSKPFDYYLIRPTSSTGITGRMIFHVTGTQGA